MNTLAKIPFYNLIWKKAPKGAGKCYFPPYGGGGEGLRRGSTKTNPFFTTPLTGGQSNL